MMNFQKMMQQAQQMQFKIQEMQEKLAEVNVESESGGGMVKVVMACSGMVKSIKIDPSIIVPDDAETLEDLIVAAVNNANTAKDERIKTETQAMMEELGLPEGTQLPGM
ncbi:MAG: nucleoid-associated protein [Micavibrio sp.]|nr:MAG: nucleoid-associated protein [Micavibrio sp.]